MTQVYKAPMSHEDLYFCFSVSQHAGPAGDCDRGQEGGLGSSFHVAALLCCLRAEDLQLRLDGLQAVLDATMSHKA